jgi:hypothetical protein
VVGRITKDTRRLYEGTGEILLPSGEVAVEGSGKYVKLALDDITDFNFEDQDWKTVPSPQDPQTIEL